jgi:putative Mg2+ transporter-C (MgtC) family protein
MITTLQCVEIRLRYAGEELVALSEWDAVIRVCVAAVLTGVLGAEREVRGKEAGLRTFTAVGIGAALFTVVGPLLVPANSDPTRIAGQVASGVGFLGAGLIFRQGTRTKNLTTAAGVWAAAALGVACGAGLFMLATATTVLMLVMLTLYRYIEHRVEHPNEPLPTEEPDN